MIDLYWSPTPNGHKITMLLEETGTPYRLLPLDISAGDQFAPAFLAISPNNKIPAIVDHDPADGGEPIAIFESGAIFLWASSRNDLYAPGLEQAGLVAADVIYAQPHDDPALLAVIEDAVRDGTPSAVVGEVSKVSMVATRRLQLVAADADMPVLLLRRRRGREQDPLAEPSAAWTRWRISSVPSARLSVAGIGRARWSVELVRQRGGDAFSLILEGCDETGRLAVPAALGHRAAETVGPRRYAAG